MSSSPHIYVLCLQEFSSLASRLENPQSCGLRLLYPTLLCGMIPRPSSLKIMPWCMCIVAQNPEEIIEKGLQWGHPHWEVISHLPPLSFSSEYKLHIERRKKNYDLFCYIFIFFNYFSNIANENSKIFNDKVLPTKYHTNAIVWHTKVLCNLPPVLFFQPTSHQTYHPNKSHMDFFLLETLLCTIHLSQEHSPFMPLLISLNTLRFQLSPSAIWL